MSLQGLGEALSPGASGERLEYIQSWSGDFLVPSSSLGVSEHWLARKERDILLWML